MDAVSPGDSRRKGPLRRLFGGLWGFVGWLRTALANLLFLLVLLLVVAGLQSDGLPLVPEQAALVLDPSGRLVEQLGYTEPFEELFGPGDQPPPETLQKDVLDAVRHAKDDERIRTLVIATDALAGAGITKTRDIAAELEAFRASGKRIIAVGDSFSQDQYLLAAQADEIWMHPMGFVDLSGIGAYRSYYKGALDKLRIDVQVFRAGTFKSAFEGVERSDMSEADRLATGELIAALWAKFTSIVTTRRKLPPEAVDHYANELDTILARHKGDAGAAAREHGFIDALKSRREVNDALVEMVGKDDEGRFNRVGFRDYLRAVRPAFHLDGERGKSAVAVIVASGTIYDGKQRAGNIGGDTLAAQLREAAREDEIKALVLRIDSPGGSGFASEIVRGALLEFRASGKPLVASMGSVAASGGYWIAAPADEIWASETTLTGSIGVLSAFPSFARGLAEIGITSDGVGTTALAGGPDPMRPLDGKWRSILEQLNRNAYERFLDVVVEGRSLDRAKVAQIAEGRVWTGEQAVRNGLVDKLGSLEQAITAAAQLAKLEDHSTRWLEPPADWRARFMAAFAQAPDVLMQQVLGVEAAEALRRTTALETLLRAADPRTPWALCTACGVY